MVNQKVPLAPGSLCVKGSLPSHETEKHIYRSSEIDEKSPPKKFDIPIQ